MPDSSLEQVPGDDDALDLVRALVDLQGLGIAHVTFEGTARDGAVLTGELEGIKGDLHGRVGAMQLCDRGRPCEWTSGPAQPGRVVSEQPGGLQTRGHVGEGEIVALLAGTSSQHGGRLVDRGLPDPQRLAGNADPAGIEGPHRDGEALAFGREPVRRRPHHVLQHELAGRGSVQAHLLEHLTDPDARRIRRDQERTHPGGPLLGAGAGKDYVQAGVSDVGDEDLGAVEDVPVAVAAGARLQRRGVRSSCRLRERERSEQLARRKAGQPSPFLFVSAEQQNRLAADACVDVDDHRGRGAGLGKLVDEEREGQGIESRAPAPAFTASSGNLWSRSTSAARGRATACASSRTASRKLACSGGRSKSMRGANYNILLRMEAGPRYLEGTTVGSGRDIIGVRRDRIADIISTGREIIARAKSDKLLPETITGATAALLVTIAGYGEPLSEGQWRELAGVVGGIMRDSTYADLARLRTLITQEQFLNVARNQGYGRFIRRLDDGRWVCELAPKLEDLPDE